MSDFRRGEAGTDGNSPVEGRGIGIASTGGPQLQQQGLLGKLAQRAFRRWGTLFSGRAPAKCGPISSPECADVTSEFLEQTFRNFHINAAPRTNLEPPWTANAIDPVQSGGLTTVNSQTFVTINSYTVQANRVGVIRRVGQAANTPAAFGDTRWRLVQAVGPTIATGAGQAVNPWLVLTGLQYFSFFGDLLSKPIILVGPQTIAWQVLVITAGNSYDVAGRLWGWDFAPLAPSGDRIMSAIAE